MGQSKTPPSNPLRSPVALNLVDIWRPTESVDYGMVGTEFSVAELDETHTSICIPANCIALTSKLWTARL